jgi:hypothetical protein
VAVDEVDSVGWRMECGPGELEWDGFASLAAGVWMKWF